MSFKDLFIVNDGDKKSKETKKSFSNKFPSSTPVETKTATPTVPQGNKTTTITPDNPACGPHLDKIMELYEEGFDGLNLDGYDFFEFFKAVVASGIDKPEMYKMALTMANAMDPNVSKTSLIEHSKFYINEINKVHSHFATNTEAKKSEALVKKADEEASLTSELDRINSEIARLNSEKVQKENALSRIDAKYTPEITEVDCKLMANDIAKDRIINSIETVVDGIKSNL